MLDLPHYLRVQAHANRLMNQRLHAAMAPLTTAELHAPRTGFFPSLLATMNHILGVDRYYIAALWAEPHPDQVWHRFEPAQTLPELATAQAASDARLVAFAQTLDAAACAREVLMPRAAGRIQRDQVAHVMAHLLMHQTHHRGQVHAMLSGTPVAPPQLDEFMMPSEAHLRSHDMASAGWLEAQVYGPVPPGPGAEA
jgi:uncharacterized damage-inducible protein DinB